MGKERFGGILRELSNLLGMSSTEKEILSLLLSAKKKLRIGEIIERLGRSERAVRSRIKTLHERELIEREPVTTESGQKAYQYFATSLSEMPRKARNEILDRLKTLEKRIENVESEK